jgi:hypothetical protein
MARKKTIEDLKAVQAELVKARRRAAALINGTQDADRMEKLAQIHQAIQGLDAVIAEGPHEFDVDAMIA